jgi:hypothetical protein
MKDHAVSHNCGSSLASLLIYHPFLYNILAIGSKYCFRRPYLNIIYLVKREPLATLQSSLNCSDLSLNSPTFHPSCASIRLAFQYSSYCTSAAHYQCNNSDYETLPFSLPRLERLFYACSCLCLPWATLYTRDITSRMRV